jgi:hypothetical protein
LEFCDKDIINLKHEISDMKQENRKTGKQENRKTEKKGKRESGKTGKQENRKT